MRHPRFCPSTNRTNLQPTHNIFNTKMADVEAAVEELRDMSLIVPKKEQLELKVVIKNEPLEPTPTPPAVKGKRGRKGTEEVDKNIPEDSTAKLEYFKKNYFHLQLFDSHCNEKKVYVYKSQEANGKPKPNWCRPLVANEPVQDRDAADNEGELQRWTPLSDDPSKENPVTWTFLQLSKERPQFNTSFYAKCAGSKKRMECTKKRILVHYVDDVIGAFTRYDPSMCHSAHLLHTLREQGRTRALSTVNRNAVDSPNRATVNFSVHRIMEMVSEVREDIRIIDNTKENYTVEEATEDFEILLRRKLSILFSNPHPPPLTLEDN